MGREIQKGSREEDEGWCNRFDRCEERFKEGQRWEGRQNKVVGGKTLEDSGGAIARWVVGY